jgi:outer membrane protein assembly factor BamB
MNDLSKSLRIDRAAALGLVAVLACASVASASDDAHWPSWRGPLGIGIAPEGSPPVRWSETENVAWKRQLPGLGTSTPIVVGDRVYVVSAIDTGEKTSDGDRNVFRFVLFALDLETGATVWERVAREAPPHEGTHPDGTYASCSPVSDGERIFAFFGSHGLYAYSPAGDLLWSKDLGDMRTRNGFGEGASPALAGDILVVNWDHEDDSFVVGLDAATGEERWRQAREEATSWSTPLVVEHAGRRQVITSATAKIRSYDAATGELLWHATGMTLNAIPTPVHDSGVVYLTSGFRGSSLMAVQLDGATGDITDKPQVLFKLDRDTPYVPSPLFYRGIVYFLKSNSGILTAIDAKTGVAHYGPERIAAVPNVYASPVAADGRIYLLGRDGGAAVIAAGPKLELLAESRLDDRFDASPVVVGDSLLLRGRKALYRIAAE